MCVPRERSAEQGIAVAVVVTVMVVWCQGCARHVRHHVCAVNGVDVNRILGIVYMRIEFRNNNIIMQIA